MNLLIIDAELPHFIRLKQILSNIDSTIHVEGPLRSKEGIKNYFSSTHDIDLILSDVRLKDGLVFEVFEYIRQKPVIFTTAYDEYALRAFKYNSIDYLLKPIDHKELKAALEKFRRYRNSISWSEPSKISLRQKTTYKRQLICHHKNGEEIIHCNEVSHIVSSNGIVQLYTNNHQCYQMELTMNELESKLDPKLFFRANRQTILRFSSIKEIQNAEGRKLLASLKSYPNDKILISKEKSKAFKDWLNQ